MKRRKIRMIIGCILLIAGIALLAYPKVAQFKYDYDAGNTIRAFEEYIEREKSAHEKATDSDDPSYLNALYEAMQAYNKEIYENKQANFKDAYSYEPASFDLTQYGFENNSIGDIDIPKMGIKLPIYLGATLENMRLGAVHLTETSIPIGGVNTNAVIAAHRGSTTAMFRDIQDLEIGDQIYITNPWGTLTYKVVEIKIIEPNEIDVVKIQEGRDLVTLSTCHPYRENYLRYEVFCERVLT